MKALTEYDKCYAVKDVARIFNPADSEREFIAPEEGKTLLDFKIIKKPSYDEEGRKIPGHYHLVREDNNLIIPSIGIGERFTPVNHSDVYEFITTKIMPEIPDMKLEVVGTHHGCGTAIVLAKMGESFYIKGDESPNSTRLMFSNPCNGYGSLVLGFTNVRLFCQNQLPVATKQASTNGFRIRHTKNASIYVGDALRVIRASMEKAKEMMAKSASLSRIQINEAYIQNVLNSLYPFPNEDDESSRARIFVEKRRDEIRNQLESGETAETIKGDSPWKLFNAITYNIYNPSVIRQELDAAQIAYSGAIGTRADKVTKIFNTIYDATLKAA